MIKEFLQNLAFVCVLTIAAAIVGAAILLIVVLLWEAFGWWFPLAFAICALVAAALTWLEHDK